MNRCILYIYRCIYVCIYMYTAFQTYMVSRKSHDLGSPIFLRKNIDDYYCDSMKFRKSDKSSDRVGAFSTCDASDLSKQNITKCQSCTNIAWT